MQEQPHQSRDIDVAALPALLAANAEAITRSDRRAYSDRVRDAADTVARMRGRFAQFGITRLADVTGLDRIGIPVWMAVRPNSRTLAVSQGKGLSIAAAQASAIMEAAEIAIAEDMPAHTLTASMADLAAERRHSIRLDALVARGSPLLDDSDRIEWVEGYDLLREETAWVPAEAVSLTTPSGARRYWQSTDGLASGNVLLEAVVHGLCERIERDAAVLWTLRSDRDVFDRCIDPASLADAAVDALTAQIDASGFQLRLFDITSDVDVPVYFATLAPKPDGRESLWKHFDLSSGSGCHPSPARAAIRALTEVAQSRITSITGARDDYDPNLYGTALRGDLLAYLAAEPAPRSAPDRASIPASADNLGFILERLTRAGIGSAIAVPLTVDDEAGFAVARLLVPELENPPGFRRQRFGKRAMRAMWRTS